MQLTRLPAYLNCSIAVQLTFPSNTIVNIFVAFAMRLILQPSIDFEFKCHQSEIRFFFLLSIWLADVSVRVWEKADYMCVSAEFPPNKNKLTIKKKNVWNKKRCSRIGSGTLFRSRRNVNRNYANIIWLQAKSQNRLKCIQQTSQITDECREKIKTVYCSEIDLFTNFCYFLSSYYCETAVQRHSSPNFE